MKRRDKKTLEILLGRLGLIYGIIVSVVNYFGFLIPTTGKMPVRHTEEFSQWLLFMDEYTRFINFVSIFAFIVPIVFCVIYVTVFKEEQVKRRIINLPLVYSLIASLGWWLSFLMEFFFVLFFKQRTNASISNILLSSFLNISQECLFISTFTFLCLDAIHRKLILPKYFPEGYLTKEKGAIKLSTRILFLFFYVSVNIFPIFYLTSTIYNLSFNYNFKVDGSVYFVLSVIFVFGLVIVLTFSNYFSNPLNKLRNATEMIKNSEYDQKVDVVSCDDFGELADNFNEMAKSLDLKTKKIFAIQDSVIKGMAVMVESRDNSTGGHIYRTSDCVKIFMDELRNHAEYGCLGEHFCNSVIKAAPMHDLGKIAVDDAILRKPGRFTDEEYLIMQKHSAEGARIVENVLSEVDDLQFKQIAINVAHYHHEKWDGSGYPEKISGEQIPLEARIMALADVFDALVSKRCYKDNLSYDKAFSIIEDSLGTHFDPQLGKIFISCRPKLEDLYNAYSK
ncbi:MAG: HD domain-containing protein [Treponema sp.]|nr:HD domain-containing protein [Treponema sp.]